VGCARKGPIAGERDRVTLDVDVNRLTVGVPRRADGGGLLVVAAKTVRVIMAA